jgi:hypothetical protein
MLRMLGAAEHRVLIMVSANDDVMLRHANFSLAVGEWSVGNSSSAKKVDRCYVRDLSFFSLSLSQNLTLLYLFFSSIACRNLNPRPPALSQSPSVLLESSLSQNSSPRASPRASEPVSSPKGDATTQETSPPQHAGSSPNSLTDSPTTP